MYRKRFLALPEKIQNFLLDPSAYNTVSSILKKAGLPQEDRTAVNIIVLRMFLADLPPEQRAATFQREFGCDPQKSKLLAETLTSEFPSQKEFLNSAYNPKPTPPVPQSNVVDLKNKGLG